VADGLARAASTLTYPNAAAALLAAVTLLSMSRHRAGSLTDPLATCVLLTGLGATLSRAGVLAFLAGLLVFAALTGPGGTIRRAAPPILGAAVAVGALIPSFPVTSASHPLIAIPGLLAGLGLTAALTRVRARVLAAVLLAGLALAVLIGARHNPIDSRLGLRSPDRSAATSVALDLVSAHPLTGVGPGHAWFAWTPPDGHARVIHYVHDEYLQLLVELGAIGLALLLCLLAAVVRAIRRRAGPLWAGAVAALVALTVHSGFDFLWHLPAILITVGLVIGLASDGVLQQTEKEAPCGSDPYESPAPPDS